MGHMWVTIFYLPMKMMIRRLSKH